VPSTTGRLAANAAEPGWRSTREPPAAREAAKAATLPASSIPRPLHMRTSAARPPPERITLGSRGGSGSRLGSSSIPTHATPGTVSSASIGARDRPSEAYLGAARARPSSSTSGTASHASSYLSSERVATNKAAPPPTAAKPPADGAKAHEELTCDKCDGKHPTALCPWFKKAREKHKDADPATAKRQLGMSSGPPEILSSGSVRVVRQPGDGSCLFHSLCYGLKDGSTASALRRQVASFIEANPNLEISDSPLKEWVLWDSGSSVAAYCRRMSQGGVWGGGIEMAAISHLKRCNVFVYQLSGAGYKRISSFESQPDARKIVRVLYGGGVHYDALELTTSRASQL